jgi:Flp pilus assembly protein TadD
MRVFYGMLILALLAGVSTAAMQRGPKPATDSEPSPFERAEAAVRSGECGKALPLLEQVVAAAPNDADALNLLAYCQRKAGRLDDAFVNYRRALDLRPEFPAAREYLGEAHLAAALRELEILRGYGEPAREELEKLVAALREAAAKAAGGDMSPAARRPW